MKPRRQAPYKHSDGSNCWTKNCRRNRSNKKTLSASPKPQPMLTAEQQKLIEFEKIRESQVEGWKDHGFAHPMKTREYKPEYRAHNKELLSKLRQAYSPEQLHALMYYTNNGFTQINSYLYGKQLEFADEITSTQWYRPELDVDEYREFLKRGKKEGKFNLSKDNMLKVIGALDSVLDTAVGEPQVLYRGVKRSHVNATSVEELHKFVDGRYKLGEEVSFTGFLSASTNPAVGSNFATIVGPTGLKHEGIVLELKTKRGIDIAPVNAAPTRGDEEEWLLPRNTRWKVVAVHKTHRYPTKNISTPYHPRILTKTTLIQLVEVE